MSTQLAYAASGTIYLSSQSNTIVNGNTVDATIHEDSGAATVNGVQANLTFPAASLSVVSITAGSAWGVVAQNQYDNSAGTINFGAGSFSALSGDQIIATVRFQAKASSGSAAVAFSSGTSVTQADGSGTPIAPLTETGLSYTLTAAPSPPPPPPPSPSPSPSPSPAPSPAPNPSSKPSSNSPPGSSKSTPSPKSPGIQIGAVASTDIGADTATITWTTSVPATSEVDYGAAAGQYPLLDSNGVAATTNHKIVIAAGTLQPGTTYHFRVKSVTAGGQTATSADYSFTTKGAILVVKILDQKNKPIVGVLVTLNFPATNTNGQKSVSGKTDNNGEATLTGFSGYKSLSIVASYGGKKTTFNNVQINPFDPKNPTQQLSFKIQTPSSAPFIVILIPFLLLGVLAGLLLNRSGKLGGNWRLPNFPNRSGGSLQIEQGGESPSSGATIINPDSTSIPVKSEPTIIRPTKPPGDSK